MDVIAHGLAAAAAALGKKTLAGRRISVKWTVCWAMFPDLIAFGPGVVLAVWLQVAGGADRWTVHGGRLPHVDFGFPVYQAAHSLVVFAAVFGLAFAVARRPVLPLLGWLLHILIDIPTHSLEFYATRFLWPFSSYRFDGIAWWTPWFWLSTYGALALVYVLLWRNGRLTRAEPR